MNPALKDDESLRSALMKWWRGLDNDRGARAELRHCSTLIDIMLTPAYQAARQRMALAGLDDSREPARTRTAAAIGLAAHIKEMGTMSPPEAFSTGDRPSVSPLRFRQILAASDDEERFRRIRRVLPLATGISPMLLASDVLTWSDYVRKKWVYAYHWPTK